jgi:hypothetical protein
LNGSTTMRLEIVLLTPDEDLEGVKEVETRYVKA